MNKFSKADILFHMSIVQYSENEEMINQFMNHKLSPPYGCIPGRILTPPGIAAINKTSISNFILTSEIVPFLFSQKIQKNQLFLSPLYIDILIFLFYIIKNLTI